MRILSFLFFSLLASSIFANEQCLESRAAFDIGSGTTKMKVYLFDKCKNIIQEKIDKCNQDASVPYKEDLKTGYIIKEKTWRQGIDVLKGMLDRAKECGATSFAGVATSAFRQAANGRYVISQFKKIGLPVSIIEHQEEGRLGFYGALATNAYSGKPLCVWDIGGSSMQIVCVDKKGNFYEYLGLLASISFKNKLVELKRRSEKGIGKTAYGYESPNPIDQELLESGLKLISLESKEVKSKLGDIISRSKVFGIGGVHYYAISKAIGLPVYNNNDLLKAIAKRLGQSDEELGGGKYADTALSNIVLVQGLMNSLDIKEVTALKVNLTEGLVSSPKYW